MKLNESHIQLITTWLRHKPHKAGFELDQFGWVKINTVLEALKNNGINATCSDLEYLNDNMLIKRWQFDFSNFMIRATHGHSVPITIDISPTTPPIVLYHGTKKELIKKILLNGILPMWRQFVNLTSDISIAHSFAQKYGSPLILTIDSNKMHCDNYQFFNPQDRIWFTKLVPSDYLSINSWVITSDITIINKFTSSLSVDKIFLFSIQRKQLIMFDINTFNQNSSTHFLFTEIDNDIITNQNSYDEIVKILSNE